MKKGLMIALIVIASGYSALQAMSEADLKLQLKNGVMNIDIGQVTDALAKGAQPIIKYIHQEKKTFKTRHREVTPLPDAGEIPTLFLAIQAEPRDDIKKEEQRDIINMLVQKIGREILNFPMSQGDEPDKVINVVTPLAMAIEQARPDIVHLLLTLGANPKIKKISIRNYVRQLPGIPEAGPNYLYETINYTPLEYAREVLKSAPLEKQAALNEIITELEQAEAQ